MQLNLFTLHFSGHIKHLEKLYQRQYLKKSLLHIRITLILGCFLYAIFGVLDAILIPAEKYLIWTIRYAFVCPSILLVLIFSRFEIVRRHIQPILAGLMVISGGGIIMMILIAPPPISYSYYAGLILIFIFGYTFIRMRFLWASLAAWLVVLLYEIAAIGIAQTPWQVITNNNFFFISANIIGMLACYSMELYDRRAFFLTQLLTEEKEKVRWANQNLEAQVAGRTTQLELEIKVRKHIENLLRESEKKYRQLFNNAPAGICEIDFIKNKFTHVNNIMCTHSGYSKKDFLSMNQFDIITNESKSRLKKRLEMIFSEKLRTDTIEVDIIKKDGQKVCVILTSDFIYDQGQLKGARVVAHDISQRKLAEIEKINDQQILEEQKKLALVGQIAGKMAHDFNNILGIIMGTAELSLMDCREAETKKSLEIIFNQTLRGKNLTKNLVAFAKDQTPNQKFFKINEKIDLVLDLLKKDLEGIELIKNHKTEVPDLLADPGMIEHTLISLLHNSIHATSKTDHPRIIINSFCRNNEICVEIEDNGCGIAPEHLESIYEPAFTLKGTKDITNSYKNGIKGTGYGMSNVKKHIEQHRGRILLDSNFGSGTKFTLYLPVVKKDLTKDEKIEIQNKLTHFEKQILLVEDEATISEIQYRILTQNPCNHIVDIAHNGQMAMDLFDKKKYDFISLDYILPGNINGKDVYNHIRKTDKLIPILFISGNIEFLESIKYLKQKDTHIDHLSKPCRNMEYITHINRLLETTLKKSPGANLNYYTL
ncbi:MAG: PAS domain S-box protein [Desulfobacteraceae bacterium]|nr:PAS domain S-box protein [Desulfobacteraceae bacterium]